MLIWSVKLIRDLFYEFFFLHSFHFSLYQLPSCGLILIAFNYLPFKVKREESRERYYSIFGWGVVATLCLLHLYFTGTVKDAE